VELTIDTLILIVTITLSGNPSVALRWDQFVVTTATQSSCIARCQQSKMPFNKKLTVTLKSPLPSVKVAMKSAGCELSQLICTTCHASCFTAHVGKILFSRCLTRLMYLIQKKHHVISEEQFRSEQLHRGM